jgi:hypothetical protein
MVWQRTIWITGLMTVSPFLRGIQPEGGTARLEIRGGAVLIGQIESVTESAIRLATSYAGVVQVDIAEVEGVEGEGQYQTQLPERLAGVSESPPVQPQPIVAAQPVPAAVPAADSSGRWIIETGFNMAGAQGNADKIDLGLTLDARLKRKFDRMDVYGRYNYGKNRGTLAANELILGGRYTNFFYNKIGFFFREELEHDDFEGLDFRSTSATGISWRVHEEEYLQIEARSGLSFRYEDFELGGTEDYPGMDFGLDVNWKLAPWVHFKGAYSLIPSVGDLDDFILTQDSGFNIPLDVTRLWRLSIGLVSKYNSQPDGNREPLDHKYYARLIASWK